MSDNQSATSKQAPHVSHPIPGEGYWYLAGPYSDNPEGRYLEHLAVTSFLTQIGLVIYSPIVHYHDMAAKYDMRKDAEFWQECNFAMLRPSNGMILVKLSGWENSKGVKAELNFCFDRDLPAWGLEPPEKLEGGAWTLRWNREM